MTRRRREIPCVAGFIRSGGRLVWANSPLADSCNDLWHTTPTIGAGGLRVGVGALAGIGFTVSLFVADLAYFPVPEVDANTAKVGILAASPVSGLLGAFVLAGGRPAVDLDRRVGAAILAVQARCWSRPTTTTRPLVDGDCAACSAW